MFNARQRRTPEGNAKRRFAVRKSSVLSHELGQGLLTLSGLPSRWGLRSPIGRRGFVGVIFPLMRSKEFLHHPVYISICRIEYNRGSSYHRTKQYTIDVCSFLPLKIFAKQKQGNAAVFPHTTLPCRSIRHTLARHLNADTPCAWFTKSIRVILLVRLYYTNFAPALRTTAQTTT